MKIKYFLFIVVISTICSAQEKIIFKQIDSTKLYLDVYYPEQAETGKAYPAMVFFFGGGWKNGNRTHFENHAKYFSKRGIVCFLVDYRTQSTNNTSPFESLKDAKSAIRFIRKNAKRFYIDSTKIIASGGSAGGHLAAATALIQDYNQETEDLSLSCIPNALVLFNPVIDNGPGGYGYERIGDNYKKFSPLHNIKKGAPPTIILLGTNDKHIPVVTAEYYKKVMDKVESRCDLVLYEGEKHGFFNYKNFESYKKTLTEADNFLVSLGYLEDKPVVKIE
ncbi:alpha/beta hydrolase [Tamlana sp. 2201CG12-4]|uniref:alpha/beta hydrolase n=1 Tax=Tamlana sp. 2201CG12-4 TaxID=3112582 RepID=UPI002DB72E05|nr:alpha/beta hydrolase [Tamlana sp. 2201CG12-4]MEC3907024.1 alpha/beta hydrolase [Tamlana sp. 2201CG12-4]